MVQKDAIIIPVTLMVTEGTGSTKTNNAADAATTQNATPPNMQDEKQKQAGTNAFSSGAKAVLSHVGGQVLSNALQGYGDITGDYVSGQNLQVAVSETAKIVGAASMGIPGMIIYGVDKGVQAFNYYSQLKRSEAQAQFAQKRVYGTTHKS